MAEGTLERPHARMFPKVVSKITTFLEDTPAVGVSALEVQLNSLSIRVFDTYRLMPLFRNSLEGFVFGAARVADFFEPPH